MLGQVTPSLEAKLGVQGSRLAQQQSGWSGLPPEAVSGRDSSPLVSREAGTARDDPTAPEAGDEGAEGEQKAKPVSAAYASLAWHSEKSRVNPNSSHLPLRGAVFGYREQTTETKSAPIKQKQGLRRGYQHLEATGRLTIRPRKGQEPKQTRGPVAGTEASFPDIPLWDVSATASVPPCITLFVTCSPRRGTSWPGLGPVSSPWPAESTKLDQTPSKV